MFGENLRRIYAPKLKIYTCKVACHISKLGIKKRLHILIAHPHKPIYCDTCRVPVKNIGCLLVRLLMLKAIWSGNFQSPYSEICIFALF